MLQSLICVSFCFCWFDVFSFWFWFFHEILYFEYFFQFCSGVRNRTCLLSNGNLEHIQNRNLMKFGDLLENRVNNWSNAAFVSEKGRKIRNPMKKLKMFAFVKVQFVQKKSFWSSQKDKSSRKINILS